MPARRTQKSEQAPAMPKYLGVFVTEDYQGNDGEEKTSYTRVGAAFPHRKGCGFNIEITEGISVSGQLVALPPRPRCSCINPLIVKKFLSSVQSEYCFSYVSCGEISGVRAGLAATRFA